MLIVDRLTRVIIEDALELLEPENGPAPMLMQQAQGAIEDLAARYVVEAQDLGFLTREMQPASPEDEDAIIGGAHVLARWAAGHDDTWLEEEAPFKIRVAVRRAWEATGITFTPVMRNERVVRYEAREAD